MRLWLGGTELTAGAASYTLSKAELKAGLERRTCPQCDGGGEVTWNPSPINDPQCDKTATCPRCDGSGLERDRPPV